MGERIKLLRVRNRLSQEELGRIVGVQKAAIHKYESGAVVNLKRSVIDALANALDTTPSYLMGWDSASDDNPQAQSKLNLLMRKTEELEPSEREEILRHFEKTIDLYLMARKSGGKDAD